MMSAVRPGKIPDLTADAFQTIFLYIIVNLKMLSGFEFRDKMQSHPFPLQTETEYPITVR